jgi:hypothetical protein
VYVVPSVGFRCNLTVDTCSLFGAVAYKCIGTKVLTSIIIRTAASNVGIKKKKCTPCRLATGSVSRADHVNRQPVYRGLDGLKAVAKLRGWSLSTVGGGISFSVMRLLECFISWDL